MNGFKDHFSNLAIPEKCENFDEVYNELVTTDYEQLKFISKCDKQGIEVARADIEKL